MASNYVKKINDLPIAASQAAPSSSLASTLNGKVGTVTESGTGTVVTSVTKSNSTVTVTKKDLIPDWGYVADYTPEGSSSTYHVYWQTQPTSSNQTYGIGILNGRLYRVYNNNGTYTIQSYDKDNDSNTVPSAYCSIASGTAAKTATCTDYALKANSYTHVLIKNANTYQGAITLNINDKGAKPIYINGSASSSSNYTLPAGTYLVFYDGTKYQFRTDGKLPASISGEAYSANYYKTGDGYVSIPNALSSKVDTITTSGTGSVVTNVTKSNNILTVTKGDISLKKLTNPNFDTITTPGIYNVQTTQACNGAPQGLDTYADGIILVVSNVEGEGITSQTAYMANGRVLSRRRWSDDTWDAFWANRESRGTASATDAHAEGDSTTANGNNSHAEGYYTRATGASSHAEGNSSQATDGQAHAEGYGTEASGASSHAEGTNTKATHNQAHAEGFGGKAYGESSHVEGSVCIAAGVSAHAEGGATFAGGKDSHAEGYSDGVIEAELASPTNQGTGTFVTTTDIVYGDKNWICVPSINFVSRIVASAGSRSFTVIGSVTSTVPAGTTIFFAAHGALSQVSHVEGYQTLATDRYTHAEGFQTQATGYVSHAEGFTTQATGSYSHAEGMDSIASGMYSHAEGYNTRATALYSHAEGSYSKATADNSHAEGIGTEANSNGMHAAGMYNATKSGYARVTGWGTYETAKDIEKLDTSGNLTLAGNIYANGNKQVSVSGHKHGAGDITSGTLPTTRGGTGVSGSTNDACQAFIKSLEEGSDASYEADYVVCQYANGNSVSDSGHDNFYKRAAYKVATAPYRKAVSTCLGWSEKILTVSHSGGTANYWTYAYKDIDPFRTKAVNTTSWTSDYVQSATRWFTTGKTVNITEFEVGMTYILICAKKISITLKNNTSSAITFYCGHAAGSYSGDTVAANSQEVICNTCAIGDPGDNVPAIFLFRSSATTCYLANNY